MDTEDIKTSPLKGEPIKPTGHLMDSKTGQLDDILTKKLYDALHQNTLQVCHHELAKITIEYDPIDLAYAVTRLPQATRHIVYEYLENLQDKTQFLINTTSTSRIAIYRYISNDELKSIIENTPSDEAASILEDLPKRRLRRILDLLDSEKSTRILNILKHEKNTAGRIMTNEFFIFSIRTTLGEVANHIRNNPGIELSRQVFVLGDNEELIGLVPSRNIIVNPPELSLKQVMRPVIHKVLADTSRDEVIDLVERYKIPALPVVDNSNHLIGIIAYEDVVEAMEDMADETIASIAGTAEDVSEHEPIFKRFLSRAPWLLVTLCAGLVTAFNLAYFQNRPWFTFVPFFVPLITGMSGNVGIQSSTILVRSMSTGEISKGTRRQTIIKELSIGLIAGIVFGSSCGLLVYGFNHFDIHRISSNSIAIGTIVSSGVFGACLVSTLLGTFSPFFFARFKIDPATAAGPIVTAFNDVLSTLMYIFIAWILSYIFFY